MLKPLGSSQGTVERLTKNRVLTAARIESRAKPARLRVLERQVALPRLRLPGGWGTLDVQVLRFSALFAVRPDLDPAIAQVAVEHRLADVEVFCNLSHTELVFFVQGLSRNGLFLGSSR